MTPLSLAEIVAEGEQAERAYRDAKAFTAAEIGAGDWCHRFYVEHGPRLLAVAKAGDRLYDYARHAPICTGDSRRPCDCGLTEAIAAWDAAEKRGEG